MCVILLTVNHCLFANGDVSMRFSGKDDNAVLECLAHLSRKANKAMIRRPSVRRPPFSKI